MQARFLIIFILNLLLLFSACSENKSEVKPPQNLLSEKQMVEILAEIQTADAAAARTGLNAETRKLQKGIYTDAIFEKYKISSKDFYSSYDYYVHNAPILDTIYAQVMKKLEGQLKVETERMKAHPPKVAPAPVVAPPAPTIPKGISAGGGSQKK